ncbi:MAG: hypothetical protein A2293_00290 [Elusimicrobia bacterium RIFOXYB2_FULL_49_7]|nr:MAG: hypothetical protein A2293_00290 [Elusimicrobia bacterium RIFOXYB2_FULL_49_7]
MKKNPSSILRRTRIITVGGGKGGVGKSIIASGLAGEIGALGRNVILVDGDLSGANLHLTMGIRYPERTLNDFMLGIYSEVEDVVLPTPLQNVSLISGASGIYELANPRFMHKQKLVASLLRLKADYLIIDVGAGSDEDNTDFFSLSEQGITVITNEPTSVENAYGFLKNGIIRKMLSMFSARQDIRDIIMRYANPRRHGFHRLAQIADRIAEIDKQAGKEVKVMLMRYHPRIVVNMVKEAGDVTVHESFRQIARKYLDIEMTYLGYVMYDDTVKKSIRQLRPLHEFPDSPAVGCLKAVARNILALEEV